MKFVLTIEIPNPPLSPPAKAAYLKKYLDLVAELLPESMENGEIHIDNQPIAYWEVKEC